VRLRRRGEGEGEGEGESEGEGEGGGEGRGEGTLSAVPPRGRPSTARRCCSCWLGLGLG
jgi:hypothetical protein